MENPDKRPFRGLDSSGKKASDEKEKKNNRKETIRNPVQKLTESQGGVSDSLKGGTR